MATCTPEWIAAPFAHSSTSPSPGDSQKWFSARRSSTASLTIPPSSAVSST
jgi:hypothetical protein